MTEPELQQSTADYDLDFFQWTQSTADLIRQGRLNEVDLEHVAEEIEDMGKRDHREVRSCLIVLVMHLLKWQAQPELRKGSSWLSTIIAQRRQLALVLGDSPSLSRTLRIELQRIYRKAVRDAILETGLPPGSFPPQCPYTADEVLDEDFYPDGPFSFSHT